MKITTLKGKQIDIAALREKHSATIALGNARMNTRGDRLGKNGEVVKSREEITKDYYDRNPNAVVSAPSPVSLKDISDEVLTPRQAIEHLEKQQAITPTKPRRKTRDSDD